MAFVRVRESPENGYIHPRGWPANMHDIAYWEQPDSPAHAWMKKNPGTRIYRARLPNVDTFQTRYQWIEWNGAEFVRGFSDNLPEVA